MKRITLVILILSFWTFETKAQMQKGSWILEGSIGFNAEQSKNPISGQKFNPQSGFSIQPKIGFFVADKLVIGASGLFGSIWTKNGEVNSSQLSIWPEKSALLSYGFGVFIRRYIEIDENLSFFGEVNAENTWNRRRYIFQGVDEPLIEDQGSTISTQANLGIQYLISPTLGVQLQSSILEYQKNRTESPIDRSAFSFGFPRNFRFGVTIFL